uniref:ORF198 n=1 Tax=Saccharolobus islandicus TaxID=43080 RepID=Q9C4X3_SACIS|nr:hypothetical protein [Sulfolobus islandicus]AAK06919.1 ORF198 [Sulfolobus islandicus]
MTIIGVGRSPAFYNIKLSFGNVYIYPQFYDDKKSLIEKKFSKYVSNVWRYKSVIKFAVYPDYVRIIFNLPSNITYIYPVHDLNDVEFYFKLKEKYNVWAGYASNEKLRNYSLEEFIAVFKDEKKWYLGVSTKQELKEAIGYGFDGFDITSMLLGRFKQIKDINYVKRKLTELLQLISRPQGKQLSLYDFLIVKPGGGG